MSVQTADTKEAGRAPLPIDSRRDLWWIEPALFVIVLLAFVVYSAWRALEGNFYETTHLPGIKPFYLSPFYSPPIQDLGIKWPISPALYIVILPLSFRLTCYYCRRVYYRALFWDPPACAVAETTGRTNYTGESRFPFNLLNLHRFALYAALMLVIFHWKHLYDAFFYIENGSVRFGMGVGTLVLALDTVMLSLYVFSCHSFRHLIGGMLNRFYGSRVRRSLWSQVSFINIRHGAFFWLSMISVGLADLYIRLVASQIITDFRLF